MSRIVPVFLLFLLCLGCEEKHFSRVYDTSVKGARVSSLRISAADPALREMIVQVLHKEKIKVRDDSSYTLEVESDAYAKHCNNPLTCTYDATYDGYVKIRLLRRMQPLYMIQQDYHGTLKPALLSALVARMYDDLDLKK